LLSIVFSLGEEAMNEFIGNGSAAITVDQASTSASRWLPALAAAMLGAVILAGVGFAPGVAHDAAHDVRHTMTFPCH
jgi:cobalt transporter subunit CbtB